VVELEQATLKRPAVPDTAWAVMLADAGALTTASATSALDVVKRMLASKRTKAGVRKSLMTAPSQRKANNVLVGSVFSPG
jgi:hypothetical protein